MSTLSPYRIGILAFGLCLPGASAASGMEMGLPSEEDEI